MLCFFLLFLCLQQLLKLDIGELPKISAPPPLAVGDQKPGSVSTNDWAQSKETSLPSRWSKMGFWSQRAVSMVEGDTGGLGWASDKPGSMLNTTSLTSSVSSSTTSSRYKTELCRTFTERGTCKYGSKCQFAHGPEELRGINRHPKYKTELCRTFHSIGFCPYGIRCHFVHNNDDDAHIRPQQPSVPKSTQRPPLLKHSFSFAGFPSNPPPLDPSFSQSSFLGIPSASPPSSGTISDLLAMAFPEFLPSCDSGYSSGEPAASPTEMAPGVPDQSFSVSLGTRSLSLTSLSDHEGRCSSSASSLSGSDLSSAHDSAAKRLPIFSQLSVPDGFCSEGSSSFFL